MAAGSPNFSLVSQSLLSLQVQVSSSAKAPEATSSLLYSYFRRWRKGFKTHDAHRNNKTHEAGPEVIKAANNCWGGEQILHDSCQLCRRECQ